MELSGWLSKLPTSCFLLVFFQLTRARELEAPSSRFSEVFDSCFSSDSFFFLFHLCGGIRFPQFLLFRCFSLLSRMSSWLKLDLEVWRCSFLFSLFSYIFGSWTLLFSNAGYGSWLFPLFASDVSLGRFFFFFRPRGCHPSLSQMLKILGTSEKRYGKMICVRGWNALLILKQVEGRRGGMQRQQTASRCKPDG